MNPILGWPLALTAVIAGTQLYGWQGLVLALTVVAFWVILQFNQVMRVMRAAADRPVGHVDSAVMLHAKLHRGMRMLDVVKLTRSLGQRERDDGEAYSWTDPAGNRVSVTFGAGRLHAWELQRPATVDAPSS
jgi:hypothetical protein